MSQAWPGGGPLNSSLPSWLSNACRLLSLTLTSFFLSSSSSSCAWFPLIEATRLATSRLGRNVDGWSKEVGGAGVVSCNRSVSELGGCPSWLTASSTSALVGLFVSADEGRLIFQIPESGGRKSWSWAARPATNSSCKSVSGSSRPLNVKSILPTSRK
jgi:hypothetical protein